MSYKGDVMKWFLTVLLLILLTAMSAFGNITFEGETTVKLYTIVKIRPKSPDYKSFKVSVTGPDGKEVFVEKGTDGWTLFTGPPGQYQVRALAGKVVDGEIIFDEGRTTVNIGKAPDPGPTPVPPPDPEPTPPPDPAPTPAPIPLAGFRVLVVYESSDKGDERLTKDQFSTIYGKTFRTLLDEKCVVGTDGKTREWRIYDKDIDLGGESKHWQDAMKRRRSAIPWIIVSNGTTGFEGELPKTKEEILALIKRYGG